MLEIRLPPGRRQSACRSESPAVVFAEDVARVVRNLETLKEAPERGG